MFLQVSGIQSASVFVACVSVGSVSCSLLFSLLKTAFPPLIQSACVFGCGFRIVGCPAHCCVHCLQTSALPLAAMFGMCALFLAGCALCQRQLARIVEVEDKQFELSDSNVNLLSTGSKNMPEV